MCHTVPWALKQMNASSSQRLGRLRRVPAARRTARLTLVPFTQSVSSRPLDKGSSHQKAKDVMIRGILKVSYFTELGSCKRNL